MRLVVGVGAPSYIVESALSAVFRAYELVGGPNVEVVVVHSGFKRAERTAGFIENLLREGVLIMLGCCRLEVVGGILMR